MAVRSAPGLAQSRVVNVYNWSDYIEPTVLEAFTKETGIKVRYDTFDSNDTLETKLLAGKSGYDVVVPTAYFLERQIKAGVFQKLDKSKLQQSRQRLAGDRAPARDLRSRQPVRRQLHVGHDRHRLQRQEGAGDPRSGAKLEAAMASWDIVFKPENLARFKDCGVHMLDSADDIMSAALNYLGLNPNSKAPADLEKAAELLMTVRPYVRKFHSSEFLNALASGEICLVLGWSGDIKQAQKRAAEAKAGIEIGYVIPKGGAQMWFDNFAIPKDAKNVAEAHAFIDYMLRPEVAAKNSNFIAYANGNLASQKFIDKAVLERSRGLSGRGDDGEPLHHHRERPEDAAADQPAVDQGQDREVMGRPGFSRSPRGAADRVGHELHRLRRWRIEFLDLRRSICWMT